MTSTEENANTRALSKTSSVTTPGLPKELYSTKVQDMLGLENIEDLELVELETEDDDQRLSQMPQELVDRVESDKQRNRTKFSDLYDSIRIVGAGSFGIVVACIDRSNQQRVALKIAAYNRKCPAQAALSIIRECAILAPMNDPNCIKLYE